MNSAIPTSDLFWGILAFYVFFLLGAGLFFARNNKSTEDFFFGGRRFSLWIISMSMLATGLTKEHGVNVSIWVNRQRQIDFEKSRF